MQVAELYAGFGLKPNEAEWRRGHDLIGGIRKGLAAIAALGAVNWARGTVRAVIETGGRLKAMSQQVGVSAETLQELGYAAAATGSDLGTMSAGLRVLARNMQSAKNGSGATAEAFRKAGVKYKDTAGKLLPIEHVMGNVADALAKLPDGAAKTALAMQLLGRGGAALIPALNGGAEGLASFRREAQDLGGVIDNKAVDSLEGLGSAVDRAKFAIQGLKNRAVIAIIPPLLAAAEAVTRWIAVYRDSIAAMATPVWEALQVAATGIAAAFHLVARAFDVLSKHPRLVRAIMLSLVIIFGVLAVKAAAVWLAGKVAFAALVAGITAIQLMLPYLVRGLEWLARKVFGAFNDVKRKVIGVARSIRDAFRDAWNAIREGARQLGRDILNLPGIRHLIKAGKFIGGKAYDAVDYLSGGPGQGGHVYQGRKSAAVGASAGSFSATVNTNVVATPGMDEEALAAKIAAHNRDAMAAMWRDAAAEVG